MNKKTDKNSYPLYDKKIRMEFIKNPKENAIKYGLIHKDWQGDIEVFASTKDITYISIYPYSSSINYDDIKAANSVSTAATAGSLGSVGSICSCLTSLSTASTVGSGGCVNV